MIQYHSDSVIQQGLSEHYNIEDLVHVDLLEHGQHRHGVDGGDQRAEQQHVEEWSGAAEHACLSARP